MKQIEYLEFDLQIERTGDSYRAQVLGSPAGNATHTFSLPFSPLELENYLLRLGATRQVTRGARSTESQTAAKQFGGRLFDTVFDGDVQGCLHSSLDLAARQGKGLRLRLRLTDAPDLLDLPWEYLYNRTRNLFYALSVETPLVRYLEMSEQITPLSLTPPLKVLVMIVSPRGYPPLDVEREWQKLRAAVRDLEERGLVIMERMQPATLPALRRRLRTTEYHIFHFVGHGDFDPQAQDGALIMEDEDGMGQRVSAQNLSMLMRDSRRSLRLAILNACEGGRGSRDDPFAGTAQRLVQQGIPAVIAMQFEITDETAIAFAQEFYAAIADGYPVDAALTEGRKAISSEAQGAEWGTPVLYMRAPDGHIFDVETIEGIPPPIPPIVDDPVGPPAGGRSPQEDAIVEPRARTVSPTIPPPLITATVKQIELEAPEGNMNPESPFYIERPSDPIALEAIRRVGGMTVTIKGPRQIGKSSLLMRMKRAAEQAGKRVAYLDFQQFDRAALSSADVFFRQFCAWVGDELGLEDHTEEFWSRPTGNIRRASRYFEHFLFKELKMPVVLAMDEVDGLFNTEFRSDFFGMLRAWHNDRSIKAEWRLLDLVQVTSTEPYRLIENLNQSPFNVGETIELADFTLDQVAELNRRHGGLLSEAEQRQLTDLLRGHPYLIRRALYLIAGQRYTLADLLRAADADGGPFDTHLSYYLMRLHEQKELAHGMLQVIRSRACAEEHVCERLESMGLARRDRGTMWPRCRLYAEYFQERLHG
jgi:hypothetical protein